MSWIKVEPYKRPKLSKSGLLAIMSPGGRRLACVAGACPDTGELLVEPKSPGQWDAPVNPKKDALLAPLREALDAELLDDFARLCMRVKGDLLNFDDPIPDPKVWDWQPGEKLGFSWV
jgi:hypothetical protein